MFACELSKNAVKKYTFELLLFYLLIKAIAKCRWWRLNHQLVYHYYNIKLLLFLLVYGIQLL